MGKSGSTSEPAVNGVARGVVRSCETENEENI